MQAEGQLVAKISVGLNGFGEAERDLVGHLGDRVSSPAQEDVFEAERLDEGLAFQQESDPFKQEKAAVQVASFKALKNPTCGLNTAFVSDHGARHAWNHCMRIPIHVLRAGIGLGMPSARPFGEGDGFHKVVALMDRLAVRNGGKAVEKSDAQPPSVGVGSVRVKGLGQPVGGDVEQQAMGHIVHSTTEPFLVNLKRVVTEVHSVGHDQIDHGVEVAVKHAAVNAQNTEAFFEQLVR